MKRIARYAPLIALTIAFGCGSRVNEALLAAFDAGARSAADVFLQDIYTDLPDLVTFPPAVALPSPEDTQPGDDGSNGDAGADQGGGADQTPADQLDGDSTAGSAFFMMNGCSACHCDDATGGCLAGAPSLLDVDTDTMRDFLLGDAVHPGGKFADLTEQGLADLAAYFADLSAG